MSNSKTNNLKLALLAILVAAVFAPTLVNAKDYTVGVKAGDWVKYGQITITWTGNGTEPSYITDAKKLDWVRIDVLSVAGTTASLNVTAHYNNGTQTFQSSDANVQSGGSMGMSYLVASNLTAGDPLTPQTPETTINQTVTRLYAGANRNVNIIDSKSSYIGYLSEYKIYWDQNTGIMVEQYSNQTDYTNPGVYFEISIKATETNLWSANPLDLIQNNLIYIIAGIAAIIVIVAAIIIVRRRKPPIPQQPLPPPPSSPPPPPS
jgi:hypothetical protein